MLLRLSDATARDLLDAIQATPPQFSRTEYEAKVASNLAEVVGNVDQDDLAELVRVAVILHITRSTGDMSLAEFVDQVIQAMKGTKSPELQPPDGNWDAFRRRLTALMELEGSLGVVAKANQLQGEYERTFHDARVLTDVRPIYQGETPELSDYVLIVHQLKIAYHEGRDLKEFFIAMDAESVQRLRSLLDRAEQKAARLISRFDETSWHVLEGEQE